MWYSPISGKYARLNCQGVINKEAVTCIKWLPGTENLFIAGYEDGR
jgi:catabolite repression protein CreC